jgi:hypothetical protein
MMLTKKVMLSADSKEVQKEYHLGKIKLLEKQLNLLNILDHPVEIQSICQKIIAIKQGLKKVENKR